MQKIALIGCGQVALSSHIPAILATPGLTLHAVCDPDPKRLALVQERHGIPHAVSSMAALESLGVDAVSITSPAPIHHQNVLVAAKLGLPVLCEKPLAMSRPEAEEMIAAMSAAGLPLYTAFCYRFSPVALKIRSLVAKGAVGKVRSLRLIYNWNLHGKYERDPVTRMQGTNIQQRRHYRMLEGGPMIDCGTHQIDLALFWLKSPIERVTGHGAWVENYEAPDHIWAHLDHRCGAHTMVEISYSYHQVSAQPRNEFVYELIGTEGVIRYDRGARQFDLDTAEGRVELPYADEKNFEGMYAEFAQALSCGQSDILATAEEGLRVTELAKEATDQAMRSCLAPELRN